MAVVMVRLPACSVEARPSESTCLRLAYRRPHCRQVDGKWREMMHKTHEAAAVIPIAQEKERLEQLLDCNCMLEAVQKGLAAYLEKKRLFFPR